MRGFAPRAALVALVRRQQCVPAFKPLPRVHRPPVDYTAAARCMSTEPPKAEARGTRAKEADAEKEGVAKANDASVKAAVPQMLTVQCTLDTDVAIKQRGRGVRVWSRFHEFKTFENVVDSPLLRAIILEPFADCIAPKRMGKNKFFRQTMGHHGISLIKELDRCDILSKEGSKVVHGIVNAGMGPDDGPALLRNKRLEIKQAHTKLGGRHHEQRLRTIIKKVNECEPGLIEWVTRANSPPSCIVKTQYCQMVLGKDTVTKIRLRKYQPCEIIDEAGTDMIVCITKDRQTSDGQIKLEAKIKRKSTSTAFGADTTKLTALASAWACDDLFRAQSHEECMERVKMLEKNATQIINGDRSHTPEYRGQLLNEAATLIRILNTFINDGIRLRVNHEVGVVRRPRDLIIHDIELADRVYEEVKPTLFLT